MKNTGKSAEKLFEEAVKEKGKLLFLFRIQDASDIKGLSGKVVNVGAKPSDYILTSTWWGTCYVEVKSTEDKTAFRFSLLSPSQHAYAKQIRGTGGSYMIYVYHTVQQLWARISYREIESLESSGKKSIPWNQLAMSVEVPFA